ALVSASECSDRTDTRRQSAGKPGRLNQNSAWIHSARMPSPHHADLRVDFASCACRSTKREHERVAARWKRELPFSLATHSGKAGSPSLTARSPFQTCPRNILGFLGRRILSREANPVACRFR